METQTYIFLVNYWQLGFNIGPIFIFHNKLDR